MMAENNELRKLQLYQLTILKDIKKVCEKHHITYYLQDGTLLGAVRHKGFIPWDDDVDISMPYDDYLRFLEIAQNELGTKYFVQNCETDENFYGAFTKIRMNNTTMMPVNHTKYHIHHGIWVDIFPIININSGTEAKIKSKILQFSNYLLMEDYIHANVEEFSDKLGVAGMAFINMLYKVPIKTRRKLHKYLLKQITKCKKGDSWTVIWTAISILYPPTILEKGTVQLEFEGEFFSAPSGWHECLTVTYGDYMKLPPVEQRKGHGSLIIDFERGEFREK